MENSFEFAVGLVNFVLLLFLLKPILIDPLRNVAREREEKARKARERREQRDADEWVTQQWGRRAR